MSAHYTPPRTRRADSSSAPRGLHGRIHAARRGSKSSASCAVTRTGPADLATLAVLSCPDRAQHERLQGKELRHEFLHVLAVVVEAAQKKPVEISGHRDAGKRRGGKCQRRGKRSSIHRVTARLRYAIEINGRHHGDIGRHELIIANRYHE